MHALLKETLADATDLELHNTITHLQQYWQRIALPWVCQHCAP